MITDCLKSKTRTQNDASSTFPETLMKEQSPYKQPDISHQAHACSRDPTLLSLLSVPVVMEPDYATIADAGTESCPATVLADRCGFIGNELPAPSVWCAPLASGSAARNVPKTSAISFEHSARKEFNLASRYIKAETVTSTHTSTHFYEVEDWITYNRSHSQVGASIAMSTGKVKYMESDSDHLQSVSGAFSCEDNLLAETSINKDHDLKRVPTYVNHLEVKEIGNSTESIGTMLTKLERESGFASEIQSSQLTRDFGTKELTMDEDYDHLNDRNLSTATDQIKEMSESIGTMLNKLEQECELGIVSEVQSYQQPSGEQNGGTFPGDRGTSARNIVTCVNESYVTTISMKENPAYSTFGRTEVSTNLSTPSHTQEIELLQNKAYITTNSVAKGRKKLHAFFTADPTKDEQDSTYQELMLESLDYDYVIV